MKNTWVFILFGVSILLWPEGIGPVEGAGVNLNLRNKTWNDNYDTSKTSASQTQLILEPAIHFSLDDTTEFIPFLSLGMEWESNPDMITRSGAAAVGDNLYRFTLGGGASIFRRFFQSWNIGFLTGFEGGLSYTFSEQGEGAPAGEPGDPLTSRFDMALTVPVILEFILTDNVTLRIVSDIVRLGFAYEESKDSSVTEGDTILGSSFPFLDDGNRAISLNAIYFFGE